MQKRHFGILAGLATGLFLGMLSLGAQLSDPTTERPTTPGECKTLDECSRLMEQGLTPRIAPPQREETASATGYTPLEPIPKPKAPSTTGYLPLEPIPQPKAPSTTGYVPLESIPQPKATQAQTATVEPQPRDQRQTQAQPKPKAEPAFVLEPSHVITTVPLTAELSHKGKWSDAKTWLWSGHRNECTAYNRSKVDIDTTYLSGEEILGEYWASQISPHLYDHGGTLNGRCRAPANLQVNITCERGVIYVTVDDPEQRLGAAKFGDDSTAVLTARRGHKVHGPAPLAITRESYPAHRQLVKAILRGWQYREPIEYTLALDHGRGRAIRWTQPPTGEGVRYRRWEAPANELLRSAEVGTWMLGECSSKFGVWR